MQSFELVEEASCQADVEYQTKLHKFQRVESLTLFFDGSFGDEAMRLTFLGVRGEVRVAGGSPTLRRRAERVCRSQFDQVISRQAVIAGLCVRAVGAGECGAVVTAVRARAPVYESRPMLEDHKLLGNNAPKYEQ